MKRAVTLTIACVLFAAAGRARAQGSHTARGRTHIGQPVAGSVRPRPARPPAPLPIAGSTVPRRPALQPFALYGFGLSWYAGWPFVYEEPIDESRITQSPLTASDATGGLRLRIEPGSAQVFVDGDYAGVADDFRGYFYHMNLAPGPHHIDIVKDAYEPLSLDFVIQEHRTVDYSAALVRAAGR
jgi:hypothetical protein